MMMKARAAVCAACIALVLCSCGNPFLRDMFSFGAKKDGGGTASDPWVISDAEGLAKIGTPGYGLNDDYKLAGDITLTGNWTPIGTSDAPFTGTFDGNGKNIFNLNVNVSTGNAGLFDTIGSGGVVKNTHITSGSVTGGSNVRTGAIAGINNGTIENCSNAATVSSDSMSGGIVGRQDAGTIRGCKNTGNVTSAYETGGIVGRKNGGTITACYNTGAINATGTSGAGGIVGVTNSAAVTACYNTGTVTCTGSPTQSYGVAGRDTFLVLAACYWLSGSAPNGAPSGVTGATAFTDGSFPVLSTDSDWLGSGLWKAAALTGGATLPQLAWE